MDALPHEKKIIEYVKAIERLREEDQNSSPFADEIEQLEEKLKTLKEEIYSKLTPWQRVQICRHKKRPQTSHYTEKMCEDFFELSGDRLFADDRAIIGGLARIDEMKCVLIGQEKGKETACRLERNFGMVSPEGFRKALKLMQLAEKFSLPVVTLIDTPGAFPGLEAEERGQGWAIAANLRAMIQLKTPILTVIIGEGCSGGALGIGVSDVVGMLEHAYYSVISPEGCASILWKDASKQIEAASALKLNAEDLLPLGAIDAIIQEPLGGAHHDTQTTITNVKQFLLEQWHVLRCLPTDTLLEQRYQKFRRLGAFQTDQ